MKPENGTQTECRLLDPAWSNASVADPRAMPCDTRISHSFETIAPCDRFEFDPDSVHDGNHGSCLDFEGGKHRTELVNGQRVVAVQQHIAAPVAHAHDEHLDLEVIR